MNQFELIPMDAFNHPLSGRPWPQPMYAHHFAQQLYDKARALGWWNALRAWVLGQPRHLADLGALRKRATLRGCHAAGVQAVPLSRITGSEGRHGDFDRWFAPLNPALKNRWQSVATARYQGVTLPLVELIRVGESYFVRDGHHRLSVARALGEEEIEALVTVWEVTGPAAAAQPQGVRPSPPVRALTR
jgi:hypothetical protein